MNELPCDGITKVPNLHDGPIGRTLNSATDLEICTNFIQISIDHYFEAKYDQSYLRDIILIISSGIIPINLLIQNVHPVNLDMQR